MARRGQHVFEIGHLEIAAADARIDHQRDVATAPVANQRARYRQGAVAGVAHPEHDLHRGIVLVDKRAQILVQAGLGAACSGFSTETGLRTERPAARSTTAAKNATPRAWRRPDSPTPPPAPPRSRQHSSAIRSDAAIRPVTGFAPARRCGRCRCGGAEPAAPVSEAAGFRPAHHPFPSAPATSVAGTALLNAQRDGGSQPDHVCV